MWWRIGVGMLLLGHAVVHAVWRTYGPKTSWMLPQARDIPLRSLATVLFVTAAVGFVLAGFTVFFNVGWWRASAVLSSGISLVLLLMFWNRGLMVGAAIALVILTGLLMLRWPTSVAVGS